MSYRAETIGKEYTHADLVFDNEMMKLYEAGDKFAKELYEITNKAFPGNRINYTLGPRNPRVD